MSNSPKYKKGDVVWLSEFEGLPRQQAVIITADVYSWGVSYVVHDETGDICECSEEQVEGLAEDQSWLPPDMDDEDAEIAVVIS
jgi:hypothetical protein